MRVANLHSPEALVLGGGGILGEAWMSAVLAGLEESEAFDARGCALYVGTSAGSIVAASLATGISPRSRLGDLPEQPAVALEEEPRDGLLRLTLGAAGELGSAAAAPLASLALSGSSGGGALLRRSALRRLPAGRRSLAQLGRAVERAGAVWDGRLQIAAVDLDSGRRVMFGAPGSPPASVAQAVQASCSIPGVFRPVRIDGRAYVDGGVWSPTNMDVAVRRARDVLCLNPTGSLRAAVGTLMGALGPMSRAVAATEALALRHRGASVRTINPDEACAALMAANLMDPRPRAAVIEAGLAQGSRLAAAWGTRAA